MHSIFHDPDKRKINQEFITAKILEIGAAFKGVRTKLKVTQTELAKSADMTQDQVSKVENGKAYEIHTLIRLCEAIGVDIKVTFKGKAVSLSTMSLPERNDYERRIKELEKRRFKRLSSSEQAAP